MAETRAFLISRRRPATPVHGVEQEGGWVGWVERAGRDEGMAICTRHQSTLHQSLSLHQSLPGLKISRNSFNRLVQNQLTRAPRSSCAAVAGYRRAPASHPELPSSGVRDEHGGS